MSNKEMRALYKCQKEVLCLKDIDGNNTKGKYGVIDESPGQHMGINICFRSEYNMTHSHYWYIPKDCLMSEGNSKSFLDI